MDILIPLLLIAVMVVFNSLYVAAEFATVGSRRSRIQESAENGNVKAKRLLAIMSDSRLIDNYVAACQIGITLSSLVAGAYGQARLTPILEPALGALGGRATAIVLVLAFITSVQVIFGELLPKTISLRYPEKIALGTLLPMMVSRWFFKPLVAIFNGSAFGILKLTGHAGDHSQSHVHSPEELAGLYRASASGGMIDKNEREMLAGILNVDARLVKEIMTPRRRLTMVKAGTTVVQALDQLANKAHTRIPVQGDGDEIIGIVNLRDIYIASIDNRDTLIGEIAKEVAVIPEVATVPNLWLKLRKEEKHCALIVNEYGSIVGMSTMEDAIEEIFGEVYDEFDIEADPILVEGNRVSLRGDVLLGQIKDRFEIDAEGIDTIGGYVWSELGRVPNINDKIENTELGISISVDEVDKTEVSRVSFELPGNTKKLADHDLDSERSSGDEK